jgi:PAS domain S-box-containing protein
LACSEALAAAAQRLGGFALCLLLRRDGDWLAEHPRREDGLRLPIRGTFSGSCMNSGRANVADLSEDLLHPRERALLRAHECSYWLAMPIVLREGAQPEGLVVGLKATRLSAGAGGEERAVLGLVAEQVALRWQVRALTQGVLDERARARELQGEAEGLLHSLRAAALVLTADDRVHDANRAAETLFGFDLTQVRGKRLAEVISEPDVLAILETVDATGGGGLPEVRLGDKRPIVLEVRITPVFSARGDLRRRVAVFNDTTLLRQADQLKTEFVSMVSHELRTPLTSIKAFASTLLHLDAEPEEQREWLRIIDRECDRLTALVNDLLTISQLDSGKPLPMHLADFDLVALLREVALMQQEAARKHTVSVAGPPELLVQADPDKLRQVALNLVNNAIKYSPRGGEVQVRVEADEETVRLAVEDNGVGIRPEHLDLVFEKFFQVDGGSTRRVGGSGLGLYLTRRLVEAHGGRITAESELGRGTTVKVTLPRRQSVEAEAGGDEG